MNCSVPRTINDCPVVVCTNTRQDYEITVRHDRIAEGVANRILRRVAPAFEGTVASGDFQAAVGAINGSSADEILAFRVFASGLFLGRPHTIGIVGIVVPRQPTRGWPLSAALSMLPAPTPGERRYELPCLDLAGLSRCDDRPFNSIDEWEATGTKIPLHGAICFCHPKSPCPHIAWEDEMAPGIPSRTKTVLLLVLAVLILVASTVLVASLAIMPAPTIEGPRPEVPEDINEGSLIVAAMRRAHFQISDFDEKVSPIEKLRAQAAGAADEARKNLKKLRGSIQSLTKGGVHAKEIALTVEGYLRKWEEASLPAERQGVSRDEAREAKEFLNLYYVVIQQAKDVIRAPNDIGVSALKEKLDEVLRPETAAAA
jgi:hypothetical protein